MKTPNKARVSTRVDVFRLSLMLLRSWLPSPAHPTRVRIEGMIRARDVASLSALGQVPDRILDPGELEKLVVEQQIRSLFKKNASLSDDKACTDAAFTAFESAEKRCRIVNKRLDWYDSHSDRMNPAVKIVLDRATQEIYDLLGNEPTDYLSSLGERIRLTSGATEDRTRRRSYPFLKITGKVRAPKCLHAYIALLAKTYGIEETSMRFEDVWWNTIAFVPKNWKTHRTIAKEATHLLPFQLTLDHYLKGRLKRWRINLRSQRRNQELARLGSIDGTLATIDLAQASDSLSYNAVAWLLPYPWFVLFCTYRSRGYRCLGIEGEYAKFSSMGNGYTFSLETLIFTALCRAVGSKRYAVYGDDIIIETELVEPLLQALTFLGFRVNREKSYVNPDSRYRESCGTDYYKGNLITPFYMSESPKFSDASGLAHLCNGLVSLYPDETLLRWIVKTCREYEVPLVPFSEDSRSGLHIPINAAYRLGMLRVVYRRDDMGKYPALVCERLVPTPRKRRTAGWRSLLLWHITARTEGIAPEYLSLGVTSPSSDDLLRWINTPRVIDGVTHTSDVAIGVRYKRKLVEYYVPLTGCPSHLYWFAEVAGLASGFGR